MRDILSDIETSLDAAPDPMRRAQENMRRPLPKRFYKDVSTGEREGVHHVLLDGRAVKTPGKNPLVFATAEAAALVADEFAAQAEEIDPGTMPCYRLANTAIDGVSNDMQAVLEDVLRYCGTDLLFYRAGSPQELADRQSELWDPVVDWAVSLCGARFHLAEGVMHVAQPREAIAAIGVHLNTITDPLALAAVHSMTTLTGSALLALAVWKGELSPQEAWAAAHVDEDWNIAQWGEDFEAERRRGWRWAEMEAAAKLIATLAA